jgi:hypothetical protein
VLALQDLLEGCTLGRRCGLVDPDLPRAVAFVESARPVPTHHVLHPVQLGLTADTAGDMKGVGPLAVAVRWLRVEVAGTTPVAVAGDDDPAGRPGGG